MAPADGCLANGRAGWVLALLAGCAAALLAGCGNRRDDGMALLRWSPVTRTTEGAPVADLAGFHVYYGRAPGALGTRIVIDDPQRTAWVVGGLAPGKWYFAVSAYTRGGIEGLRSNVASKTIR